MANRIPALLSLYDLVMFDLIKIMANKEKLNTPSKLGVLISNPYAEVCWDSEGRYRANFHAHTTGTDGRMNPHEVVDAYHELGYSILALTDHNAVTYPWTAFTQLPHSIIATYRQKSRNLDTSTLNRENRDPEALSMIAIQGNELSNHHHMGSFFSDYNEIGTEVDSLKAIAAKGGTAVLCHPGCYDYPATWYLDLYQRFPHLVGLEVFNKGDTFPNQRAIWDTLLSTLMPDRPVWGYANDDMHLFKQLGRNYSVMLLPELSEKWVRHGMEHGRFYFVYNPEISDKIASPTIQSIHVDAERDNISIQADGQRTTVWISNGKEIHCGDEISLSEHPCIGNYVRAELRGANGAVVCTQPFGLPRAVRATLSIAAKPGSVDYTEDGKVQAVVHLLNLTEQRMTPKVEIHLGTCLLQRKDTSIEPQATLALPISVPVSALNSDQTLSVKIDLGKEFIEFRHYEELLPLTVEYPVEVKIDVPSLYYADIQLHNLMTEREFTVNLVATVEGKRILQQERLLPAGKPQTVRCPLPASLTGKADQLQVAVQWPVDIGPANGCFSTDIDFRKITRMPRRTNVGNFDEVEWGETTYTLDTRASVNLKENQDQWQGVEDASADFRWFCTDNYLWLAADVRDDYHVNNKEDMEIWNGDALQIGIAPIGVEATNIILALTDSGVQCYQWCGVDRTLMKKSKYTITRDDVKAYTHYRLRLPLSALGLASESGTLFGLSAVLFDDDDGKGTKFWMETSPGLAIGWNPLLFKPFAIE